MCCFCPRVCMCVSTGDRGRKLGGSSHFQPDSTSGESGVHLQWERAGQDICIKIKQKCPCKHGSRGRRRLAISPPTTHAPSARPPRRNQTPHIIQKNPPKSLKRPTRGQPFFKHFSLITIVCLLFHHISPNLNISPTAQTVYDATHYRFEMPGYKIIVSKGGILE